MDSAIFSPSSRRFKPTPMQPGFEPRQFCFIVRRYSKTMPSRADPKPHRIDSRAVSCILTDGMLIDLKKKIGGFAIGLAGNKPSDDWRETVLVLVVNCHGMLLNA